MAYSNKKVIRKSFGRLKEVVEMPNLVAVQKASYDAFISSGEDGVQKNSFGLENIFKDIFPVRDFSGRCQVEFIKYELEAPKYDVMECRQRGLTYASVLRAAMRFVVWDVDGDTGTRSIKDIKEQDVYMGDLPRMTDNGTFIINGTERVIVSQMHRSPGVFFDHDNGKGSSSGQPLFSARIIPYRGSWVDFEFDSKNVLYVRIDKRRKFPVTTLLMALDGTESGAEKGVPYKPETLLKEFYDVVELCVEKNGISVEISPLWIGYEFDFDVCDLSGNVLLPQGKKVTKRAVEKWLADGHKRVLFAEDFILGQYVSSDLTDNDTGEVFLRAGDAITVDHLAYVRDFGSVEVLHTQAKKGWVLRNTLAVDKNQDRSDALVDIYRILRPGEPATFDVAERIFKGLLFDIERYDLSDVGRVKMNTRLNFDHNEVPDTVRTLRKEDILAIVKYLIDLKAGNGEIDDIDHLGNRRVRSVGELMENQYRIGMLRVERSIRERMTSVDLDTVMPHDLVNAKPLISVIREFFGSSQLSQFMDQTNPLAEVTHKRRLSALGPGGLTRDRAGFEVRDVHPTHYGRICPIETPEGPNIGLINSLATYARVNQYGFIETPYRKVKNGVVTDEYLYMAAMDEGRHVIAEASAPLDDKNCFKQELIACRSAGDYIVAKPEDIDYMDVSPKQLVSVAASLIPFLENDDANRALMGSNMQRQAVPLLKADAPLVGTGMEKRVAHDSGVAVYARRRGIVNQVDGNRVVVHVSDFSDGESGIDIYNLMKFQRSNQNTCISQKPLVNVGDVVEVGDIIADGSSTDKGELALGRNMLVAFMPWNGYNYEDSILISERVVRDDVFTSIHIEEFELMVRDTKLGQEEITRDIPNLGEEALKNLDETGIVYVGAEVKTGDILVGKVTPKGESPVTPEEKLLRAIFGEKASDVRDSSLRLPPGNNGTVVEVRVFSRRGLEKDERSVAIEEAEIDALAKDREAERAVLERSFRQHYFAIAQGHLIKSSLKNVQVGESFTEEMFEELTTAHLRQISVEDEAANVRLDGLKKQFQNSIKDLESRFADKVEKIQTGDGLMPGVMKMIKVFVAVKRKLQPGDKMAGRHGNKGVVSKIVPIEDMPHLEDGTPVDVVLNPLGVPSRMNVGQILETHLGWASAGLGRRIRQAYETYRNYQGQDLDSLKVTLKDVYADSDIADRIENMDRDEVEYLAQNASKGVPFATPVFDGAAEVHINAELERAGVSISGQERLIDGRTGEFFTRPVTVGYMYILKLHHLVDEKIHARSIGPYSLVTQQPLGGKAQFGGQRFGEMEVWALEAYGAAHVLQEMLTVKSDDVTGRTRIYESIVRGDNNFIAGVPESFNVLVKELKSLGLNIELLKEEL